MGDRECRSRHLRRSKAQIRELRQQQRVPVGRHRGGYFWCWAIVVDYFKRADPIPGSQMVSIYEIAQFAIRYRSIQAKVRSKFTRLPVAVLVVKVLMNNEGRIHPKQGW